MKYAVTFQDRLVAVVEAASPDEAMSLYLDGRDFPVTAEEYVEVPVAVVKAVQKVIEEKPLRTKGKKQ